MFRKLLLVSCVALVFLSPAFPSARLAAQGDPEALIAQMSDLTARMSEPITNNIYLSVLRERARTFTLGQERFQLALREDAIFELGAIAPNQANTVALVDLEQSEGVLEYVQQRVNRDLSNAYVVVGLNSILFFDARISQQRGETTYVYVDRLVASITDQAMTQTTIYSIDDGGISVIMDMTAPSLGVGSFEGMELYPIEYPDMLMSADQFFFLGGHAAIAAQIEDAVFCLPIDAMVILMEQELQAFKDLLRYVPYMGGPFAGWGGDVVKPDLLFSIHYMLNPYECDFTSGKESSQEGEASSPPIRDKDTVPADDVYFDESGNAFVSGIITVETSTGEPSPEFPVSHGIQMPSFNCGSYCERQRCEQCCGYATATAYAALAAAAATCHGTASANVFAHLVCGGSELIAGILIGWSSGLCYDTCAQPWPGVCTR